MEYYACVFNVASFCEGLKVKVHFSHALGNLLGLHSGHGSFNIPNMPGTFASRNSTANVGAQTGVQQAAGSISNGRFNMNNLPPSLSQVILVLHSVSEFALHFIAIILLRLIILSSRAYNHNAISIILMFFLYAALPC